MKTRLISLAVWLALGAATRSTAAGEALGQLRALAPEAASLGQEEVPEARGRRVDPIKRDDAEEEEFVLYAVAGAERVDFYSLEGGRYLLRQAYPRRRPVGPRIELPHPLAPHLGTQVFDVSDGEETPGGTRRLKLKAAACDLEIELYPGVGPSHFHGSFGGRHQTVFFRVLLLSLSYGGGR